MDRLEIPLNLEMAATDEMQAIALRHRPHAVCLVPERRAQRIGVRPAACVPDGRDVVDVDAEPKAAGGGAHGSDLAGLAGVSRL